MCFSNAILDFDKSKIIHPKPGILQSGTVVVKVLMREVGEKNGKMRIFPKTFCYPQALKKDLNVSKFAILNKNRNNAGPLRCLIDNGYMVYIYNNSGYISVIAAAPENYKKSEVEVIESLTETLGKTYLVEDYHE